MLILAFMGEGKLFVSRNLTVMVRLGATLRPFRQESWAWLQQGIPVDWEPDAYVDFSPHWSAAMEWLARYRGMACGVKCARL